MEFTNENILKYQKSVRRDILISICIILISIICYIIGNNKLNQLENSYIDLNNIIIEENNLEKKHAYLDIYSNPYLFASHEGNTDGYYIVSDDKYIYIAYMSLSDIDKMNLDSVNRIKGITKNTPLEVKQMAIEAYNNFISSDMENITINDFDNYFSPVYLDLTEYNNEYYWFVISLSVLIFGSIYLIISFSKFINFHKTISSFGYLMADIEREIIDNSSIYYKKFKLYLTDNYIISFRDYFRIIKYSDILWMYPYEHRSSGIKTLQSIKLMNNSGKTYSIAKLHLSTKELKNNYKKIWHTILDKNNKIITGYTKENIKFMKNIKNRYKG